MKRRDFLKVSFGTLAAASIPGTLQVAVAKSKRPSAPDTATARLDGSPRRVELLDANWRFKAELVVPAAAGTPITDWVWHAGTPDQKAAMIDPKLDTSTGNWAKTTPGVSTLAPGSFGWFRTTLPEKKGPGRSVHFESVDDNGTVFLNGQQLAAHQGYADAFDVPLDSAWNENGPNVLVVLIENVAGQGGLMKDVTFQTTAQHSEFADAAFNDRSWRTVRLPHDYIVEGDEDPSAEVGHGSLPKFPAWYRRTLDIPASDKGKSLWLYFEGVYRNATVYLNGQQIFFQDDGYDPFNIDITKAVNYGKTNVIAVHVDPRSDEGWWYEGGGIYRHVWLNVADPLHVAPWGVYVTSDVHDVTGSPSATLTIKTTLANEGAADRTVTVATQILDPSGAAVASVQSSQAVPAGQDADLVQTADVKSAMLWSLEQRNMYHAVTTVTDSAGAVDSYDQRFGIRTIRFDIDKGFFLNEKPVKLQGTCNHQDFCGVGIAMPDSILYWRMQRLQDTMSCNAIRCSHNPMAVSMYDACDDLGLVVMDETRHPGDTVAAKARVGTPYAHTAHIEKMILRDRNHPSVIMWSMANEEGGVQGNEYGAEMFTALMAAVHKHDTTRPITSADNQGSTDGWKIGFGKVEDILGVNYNTKTYDWLRENAPGKMVYGSEIGSSKSCRGIYKTDADAGHLSSYMTPESAWQPIGSRDFVAGGFVWTGFDYRGETSPYKWPEINSNYGLLDMCGFPKDDAFYYKAWWKQSEPLVHIFPHWNWAGQEGQNVPVWCFSNCDSVELFLNGTSLGSQPMPKFTHVKWDPVPYAAGKLEVRGTINGKVVVSKIVETTGAPAAITLTSQRSQLLADSMDIIPVEVAIVDAQGRVVPTAGNKVSFSVKGVGTNAGVGNGDPASHERSKADSRSAFAGLCMVLVQATDQSGAITLVATADGLAPAHLQLRSVGPTQ